MTNDLGGTQLRVEVPKTGLPAPEAANFFYFSFSGPEVQLLIGFIDLNDLLREAGIVGTPDRAPIKPEITHRILMSPRGFAAFRQQMNDIAQKWDAAAPKRMEELK
jgi:hypothetical protein